MSSKTTRYGSIRTEWRKFVMLNAAPTKVQDFIEPPEGNSMEVMLQLEAGVIQAHFIVYRYALIGDVECIAQVSTATLSGDAGSAVNHLVAVTHNGDRICATIQPHGGSDPSGTIAAYRLF